MFSIAHMTLGCALIALVAMGNPALIPDAAAQTSIWVDHGLPDAVRAGESDLEPFFPDARYDPSIPSPQDALGFPMGARPVRHQEVMAYLETLADVSPHVRLIPYGKSHEGRILVVAVITSESNMARLEEIRKDLALLADPRESNPPPVNDLPLCVWAGCCVHGDETSSTDAALAIAYHLAACRDPEVAELRDNLLILLDPLQNPDGRERILAHWESLAGRIPDGDDQSLRHLGLWPGGRTNHYLFDLNRDWFLATQPETYAKLRLVTSWNPQLIIDAHEMNGQSTYLFSPPREPFNPLVTDQQQHWWRVFAAEQAAAFDRYGWEYYTREWHEEWFPGFASSWSGGIGAVGILYEQAGVEGTRTARYDGTVMVYRETVRRQITSFMSNFRTAARNREDLLRSYREERVRGISGAEGALLFVTHSQPAREDFLLRSLMAQEIEIYRSTRDLRISGLRSFWSDETAKESTVPEGTIFVPLRQPLRRLVETICAFDPQMEEEFLRTERRRLEKEHRSRLYEATGWSVSLSSGLPVYHSRHVPWEHLDPVEDPPIRDGQLVNPRATFGFLIDGTDDRCLRALAHLWQSGCTVHAGCKPFTVDGTPFARGTLLVRRVLQNGLKPLSARHRSADDPLAGILRRVAAETGVVITGVSTALSDSGPDLGGRQFRQLEKPRIGLLAGDGISFISYGGMAWLLDHETDLCFASLPASNVSRLDLNRYNVLILPDTWRRLNIYPSLLDAPGVRKLRAWVRSGGTLIAVGCGTAFVADSTSSLGSVRLRRQVLATLAEKTGRRSGEADGTESGITFRGDIREQDFRRDDLHWAKAPGPMDGLLEDGLAALRRPEPFWKWAVGKSAEELEEEDARMRLFQPRGSILKVDLDEEHWLAAGCGVFSGEGAGSWMPVQVYAEHALVASGPDDVVGAFASEDSLRLSGLLWPEARERWAHTAYLTRERVGRGQVILFVSTPCQRAAFKATERAFLNAVLLGPGLGTSREWPW